MKQFLIIFITCIFVLAVFIGRCNDDTTIDEERTEFVQAEKIDNTTKEKNEKGSESEEYHKKRINKDSAFVIPKEPNDVSSQILVRKAYTTSYNRNTRCPNWVAWELTREHTYGPFSRDGVPYYADDGTVYGIGSVSAETIKNCYIMDLESEEPRQQLMDWSTKFNMSHGHMCPAGDNKWDKSAMNQTFLLTNMCPQDEKLNNGGWRALEEKCRSWARLYGEIYIVAGPIYNGIPKRYLGQIAIPDAFFKVILCINNKPKAIGFVYQNDSFSQSFRETHCTVDSVESITGFDFFGQLEDSIEEGIESHSNLNDWK